MLLKVGDYLQLVGRSAWYGRGETRMCRHEVAEIIAFDGFTVELRNDNFSGYCGPVNITDGIFKLTKYRGLFQTGHPLTTVFKPLNKK